MAEFDTPVRFGGLTVDQHRALLSVLSEGVVIVGADGAALGCNAAAERILGLSEDQITGRRPADPRWQAIHEDGTPFPSADHPVSRALRTGESVRDVVIGVRRGDGALVWVLASAEALFEPGAPHPYAAVGVFTDITARYEAEAQSREQELDLQAYLHSPGVGVAILDPDDRWLEVNDKLCAMVGYSREELSHLTWAALSHPEDRDAHNALTAELLTGRRDSVALDTRYLRKDGTELWTLTSVSCARRPDGALVHRVAILKDITRRKAAEALLERTGERLRHALEGSNDGFWDLNLVTGAIHYSDRMAAMLGYSPEELHRDVPDWRMLVHPDDAAHVDADARANMEGTLEQFDSVHRVRCKDGQYLWVRVRARVAERDAVTGAALRAAGTVTDVDAIRRAEDQLKASLAENERLVAELRVALDTVRQLSRILPVCSFCGKIRDEQGAWLPLDEYITKYTDTRFSHGFCQACVKVRYPDVDTPR